MAQKKNNSQLQDQSLLKLVTELKEINNFEIELPQDSIDLILQDPKLWAEEFTEDMIIKFIPKFLKSKKLGEKLAEGLK